jgi:hypothetical protein
MKGIQLTVGNLIGLDKTVGGRKLLKAMSDEAYAGVAYSARSADGSIDKITGLFDANGIPNSPPPATTFNDCWSFEFYSSTYPTLPLGSTFIYLSGNNFTNSGTIIYGSCKSCNFSSSPIIIL